MTVRTYRDGKGPTIASFLTQDSGNKAYIVQTATGLRWMKVLDLDRTPVGDLDRLVAFYNSLQSDLVPRNWIVVRAGDGVILECDWVPGDVLYSPTASRTDPASAYRRFQALPTADRQVVFQRILDLFVELQSKNAVVEDFYDGCIIYDFDSRATHVCDLDHVHWGPYVLDRERQFGSARFMAPEEWRRGSRIDRRTAVYTMGATGFVLLADNRREKGAWPLSSGMWETLARAISSDPSARQQTVAVLRGELLQAAESIGAPDARQDSRSVTNRGCGDKQ